MLTGLCFKPIQCAMRTARSELERLTQCEHDSAVAVGRAGAIGIAQIRVVVHQGEINAPVRLGQRDVVVGVAVFCTPHILVIGLQTVVKAERNVVPQVKPVVECVVPGFTNACVEVIGLVDGS